ncbi:MAG: glycosyltransferase N-terminal domain-containing protein [Planctomycetota bacterium]
MMILRWLLALILDVAYLVGGLLALAISPLRGRAAAKWDHVKRRVLAAYPRRDGDRPCLWVHGVSVGEVLAARELVARFRAAKPDWDVVISSSTKLGVEAATKAYTDDIVVSYPMDFSLRVASAFRKLRPAYVLIVEHDLWPNFLAKAKASGVPCALINAKMSEGSASFLAKIRYVFPWPPRHLRLFTQDGESADRFEALGFENVVRSGSLKFDGPVPAGSEGLRGERGYAADDWIFLAGSTHEGEEEAALDAFALLKRQSDNLRLILVPRRIERTQDVAKFVEASGFTCGLWSEGAGRDVDVVVVDTMGELAKISGMADAVFVGGTLAPVGGHNVIEPAVLGKPVLVGPHFFNAKDVVRRFVERDAIVVVQSSADLTSEVSKLRAEPDRARSLGERAAEVVKENLGATERVLQSILSDVETLPDLGAED